MAEKKERKYVSDNAQLMAEWDWEKNNDLNISPDSVALGSHREVWWKCSKGHSWSALVSNRARLYRNCPYCAGQKPIVGENDLCTTHPALIKEWHPTKNDNCSPEQFMKGSHKKVWWICNKGHEWSAVIKSRASGVGCPYCANKKVLKGFNDLETTHPELAKEWHPTKNEPLTPSQITYGSGKLVWWMCKNAHEWSASVCDRKHSGCPICSSRRRTSFPEQAVFFYIKQAFPDAINGYKEIFTEGSMELDIFIPQINVGIEYDGKAFHSKTSNRLRDAKKYKICNSKGITLIRITDNMQTEPIINCDRKITIPHANDLYLGNAIAHLLYKLEKPMPVCIQEDRHKILSYLTETDYSLEEAFPTLAKEWNYEKNGDLLPSMFHPGSNEKVWWKCLVCGNEWKTSLAERTGRDQTGCAICARKTGAEKRKLTTLKKNGSLAEKAPHLLNEWCYDKNNTPPELVPCTSNKKVWWKCQKCGYSWQTTISHRVARGSGCPCCRNQVVVEGINDLSTTHPELIDEWNFEKNSIKPSEICAGSSKKVWWKCKACDHEWLTVMNVRTHGSGCPKCAKQKRKTQKETP